MAPKQPRSLNMEGGGFRVESVKSGHDIIKTPQSVRNYPNWVYREIPID